MRIEIFFCNVLKKQRAERFQALRKNKRPEVQYQGLMMLAELKSIKPECMKKLPSSRTFLEIYKSLTAKPTDLCEVLSIDLEPNGLTIMTVAEALAFTSQSGSASIVLPVKGVVALHTPEIPGEQYLLQESTTTRSS